MKPISRSEFLKKSAVAGGALVAPAYVKSMITDSPNERINVAPYWHCRETANCSWNHQRGVE